MAAAPNEKLTRREREIMDVIFALSDRASVEEIRERLTDPPSYSAVRAMLVKLEAKGVVRHHEEGLRYIYTPVASRKSAQRGALERLVQVFFSGSPGQTAVALLKQETWTDEELDTLGAEIEQARNRRSKR